MTPLSYGSLVRAFRGPLITAFATASLLIVLQVLAADGMAGLFGGTILTLPFLFDLFRLFDFKL